MKRSYKQEAIVVELRKMLSSLRLEGNGFLPGERELCEMLGVSRGTLRRALSELEEQGFILKGAKGRVVAAPSEKSQLRIGFVAHGIGLPVSPVWLRLWTLFSAYAEKAKLNVRLNLIGWKNPAEDVKKMIADPPDVLVFAGSGRSPLEREILSLKGRAILIAVDEALCDECDYYVGLDNYAVGCLAGEEIAASRYEHPLFLGWGHKQPYRPFGLRLEGFRAGLEHNGIALPEESVVWIEAPQVVDYGIELMHFCEALPAGKFDAVFCHSDEYIEFAHRILSKRFKLPAEFGMITLASTMDARMDGMQLHAILHAEAATAAALVALIETIQRAGSSELRIHRLLPEVFAGSTLR